MSRKIFLPKWTKLLVILYNTPARHRYCGKLHRKTGMTVRHVRDLITDLEKLNLVSRQEGAKIRYINLTESGKRLAKMFLEVYQAI